MVFAPGRKQGREIEYPSSDGKPRAETEKHLRLMIYCIEALGVYFATRSDVYVCGNNFVYWQEGNPRLRVAPDCYVVFGADKRVRDSYKAWEEGGALPAVVFEMTSKKTRAEDVTRKRPLYETALRVPEYFQFDPTRDYLKPNLQGFRLNAAQVYESIPLLNNRLYSEQLDLEVVALGQVMRFYDRKTGEFLLTSLEYKQRADAADARAAAEAIARADAEARLPRRKGYVRRTLRRK